MQNSRDRITLIEKLFLLLGLLLSYCIPVIHARDSDDALLLNQNFSEKGRFERNLNELDKEVSPQKTEKVSRFYIFGDHQDEIRQDARLNNSDISDNPYLIGNHFLSLDETALFQETEFKDDSIFSSEKEPPQHISVGVAAVWLMNTQDIAAATLLRIYLTPRSYSEIRNSYWEFPVMGLLQLKRWDLNFGVTAPAATTKHSYNGQSERKVYVLLGASNQLNRSALFNMGIAAAPGDIKGKEAQLYFGFTVDFDILKELGFIENK